MNEDGTPIVEQPEAPAEQAGSGLIIDNDTGEPSQPHPLAAGVETEEETPETPEATAEEVETPAATVETPQAPATQPTPVAPAPTDPGEFQPQDYSFEVTLADGTKHTIAKPEDIDKLPEQPEFASIKDHTQFINSYSRMVNGIDTDKRQWESDTKAWTDTQESAKAQEEYFSQVDSSMKYLEQSGKLPAVPAQYAEADWSDPEVMKQPGVKERVEIIEYMAKENAKRDALGLPKMDVLSAHSEMRNKQYEDQQATQGKAKADHRKKQGAMVTGPSAPAPGKQNTDMIVGSGGSLGDLGY